MGYSLFCLARAGSGAEPSSRDFKYLQAALFLCPKCLGFLVYIGSEVISDFPKILGIDTRSYTLSTEQAKFTSAPGLSVQLTFPLFALVDYVILFYSNQIILLRSFLPVIFVKSSPLYLIIQVHPNRHYLTLYPKPARAARNF